MKKKYFLVIALFMLCITTAIGQVTYSGPYSSNSASPTPLTLGVGTNTISGTATTPPSVQQWFDLTLPAGQQITNVTLAVSDPASVSNGTMCWNPFSSCNPSDSWGSGGQGATSITSWSSAGTLPINSSPGVIQVIHNVAFNTTWTLVISVTGTACSDPTVPSLTATPNTVCPGGSVTLSLTGTLNDATNWQWYSGSCGGTSVGSGTSITVNPTANTTYFARGEGGCVTPGTCASVAVTATDSTPPTAVCQNATVQLDAAGNAGVTAAMINNGSSDACGIASLSVSPSSFTCANIGANTVTLTVTDNNGNVSTCTATVTVEDIMAPVFDNIGGDGTLANPFVSLLPAEVGSVPSGTYYFNFNGSTFQGELDNDNAGGSWLMILNYVHQAGDNSVLNVRNTDLPLIGASVLGASEAGSSTWGHLGNTLATDIDFEEMRFYAQTSRDVADIIDFTTDYVNAINYIKSGNGSFNGINTPANYTLLGGHTASIPQNAPNEFGNQGNFALTNFPFWRSGQAHWGIRGNGNRWEVDDFGVNNFSTIHRVWVRGDLSPAQPIAPTEITVQLDANGNVSITTGDFGITATDNCSTPVYALSQTDFDCSNVGANTIQYTATDAEGNVASIDVIVNVEDTIAPIVTCQDITVELDANGMASITADDILPTGDYVVDQTGTFNPIDISVTGTNVSLGDDVVSPSLPVGFNFNFYGNDYTDFNISSNGFILFDGAPGGTADQGCCSGQNIPNASLPNNLIAMAWEDINPSTGGTISYQTLGTAPNRILVVDFNNVPHFFNQDPVTMQAQLYEGSNRIEIHTTAMPTDGGLHTQGIENADGTMAITTPGRNAASWSAFSDFVSFTPMANPTDNCGVATTVLSQTDFTCADVGDNTITVTVTDVNGNTATCTSTVTVQDNIAPEALCTPFTAQLDNTGNVTITPADVDGGSNDACGVASLAVSPSSFSCANVGDNTVTLTVTDNNGNVSTCTTTVTVEDSVAPNALCVGDFTIQLDANGDASIAASDIDNGSNDACGIANTSIDVTDFTCADVGANTVTLTVTDNNGNEATCTTIVTVEDNVAPTAVCQNIDVFLDASGNATIVVADVDGGSNDACGVDNIAIDVTSFTCDDLGANDVILTVTDNNGNMSTCTAIVTVIDDIAPTMSCPLDFIVSTDIGLCSAMVTFTDALAADNCAVVSVIQTAGLPSGSDFPLGDNVIQFTATDSSGNTTSCSFTITVEDNEAPMTVCQDITIQLDDTGNATIVAADVDGGSNDACGIADISIDIDTFDCSHVGDNDVTLTVTDVNGNTSSCIAIVTVEDVTAPAVVCQDITVQLDDTGMVTIAGLDVDGGSSDACGIASYDLDIDTFDCSMVGDNTVTLTVTDVNGNSASCMATVTVEDLIDPTLVCMDITVELDENGMAVITPEDVIASNDDNCGIATTAVDIFEFDCSDIGTPVTVQIFAEDSNGNLATCTAVVTVVDTLAPEITCPADQTVDPGPGNLFYEVPDYLVTGEATVSDNCTDPVTIVSQDPAPGTLISDGVYTVTITAEDEYGNVGECEFELTVESVLGLDDNVLEGAIVLYPNPAQSQVTLANTASIALETAAIFDTNGRLIKTIDLSDMQQEKLIDVSTLATGVYMVQITSENASTMKRLVKE